MPANSANARKARAARRRFRKTRTDEYEMSHFFDRGVRRGKPTSAAERRKRRRSWGNPALKPVRKSTGWLNGPAGTNTQIKFKKNPGGRTEVYIRRKARTNSASGAKKAREYHAEKMRKTGRYNTGQYRNVGGFVDASGEFHPIRDSEGYNYAGVIAKKKRAAARKRAPAKRKTSTRKRR